AATVDAITHAMRNRMNTSYGTTLPRETSCPPRRGLGVPARLDASKPGLSTIPILGVYHERPSVHVALIFAFKFDRSWRSSSAGTRTFRLLDTRGSGA